MLYNAQRQGTWYVFSFIIQYSKVWFFSFCLCSFNCTQFLGSRTVGCVTECFSGWYLAGIPQERGSLPLGINLLCANNSQFTTISKLSLSVCLSLYTSVHKSSLDSAAPIILKLPKNTHYHFLYTYQSTNKSLCCAPKISSNAVILTPIWIYIRNSNSFNLLKISFLTSPSVVCNVLIFLIHFDALISTTDLLIDMFT